MTHYGWCKKVIHVFNATFYIGIGIISTVGGFTAYSASKISNSFSGSTFLLYEFKQCLHGIIFALAESQLSIGLVSRFDICFLRGYAGLVICLALFVLAFFFISFRGRVLLWNMLRCKNCQGRVLCSQPTRNLFQMFLGNLGMFCFSVRSQTKMSLVSARQSAQQE